ncbi:MAG: MtrAB system histidine kinase MtrB [Dermatophilaceae bacterium]
MSDPRPGEASGEMHGGIGPVIRAALAYWRRSLSARVVATTMVLGLVMTVAIGSYLYNQVATGLVADAERVATAEALRLHRETQSQVDHTDKASVADLQQLAEQLVQSLAGGDGSRYAALVRSAGNTNTQQLSAVMPRGVGIVLPEELRQAVAANPDVQQTQVVSLVDPATGTPLSAVVVGQQVSFPVVGEYSLFLVYPMSRERDTLSVIARSFGLGAALIVLLVGAIAWAVSRLVVRPVRQAAGVAEQLASGHLEERMPIRGEDDLARLGKSFNEMAAGLQEQIVRLEQLSTVQQQFVSDVSHELRTPLTTIRMAADLIHDSRAAFDPAVSRSAELLHAELDRFEALLSDLLEISRYDAGAAVIDVEPTDVRSLVARVVASAAPLAQRRGSPVDVIAPSQPCIADVESRRIERILRNLVVNAIEHGEGHPIVVTVAGNESAVAVSVRDHGVGLRPGDSAKVFNRFWRGDPARARTTGGTGLGLAISLQDARLHHGWLQAWGAPGVGSCFRLTVPRSFRAPIDVSPLPLNPTVGLPVTSEVTR